MKTLGTEEIGSVVDGIYINKNVVHLVENISACKYKSFLFPEYFVYYYLIAPTSCTYIRHNVKQWNLTDDAIRLYGLM